MTEKETIVMSVGGSLIVPDQIDVTFLKNLKDFVANEVANYGRRFIIIAGGGRTARNYQEAAQSVTGLDHEDLDWLGIHATRLNGHLLRTIFKELAYPETINNPDDVTLVPDDTPLIIATGYRPGASTDLRAVQIAKNVEAKKVVNLSNTDYVYTADPKSDPSAKKIENITWSEFRQLIPAEWSPGLSAPFDPEAAKVAEVSKIEVAAINGEKLGELKNYLNSQPFIGTKIHN